MEQSINYSALSGMKRAYVTVFKRHKSLRIYGILSILLFALGLVGPFIARSLADTNKVLFMVPLNLGLAIFFVLCFWVTHLISRQQALMWREFAASNGWHVISTANTKLLVPPILAKKGHSASNGEALSGKLGNQPFTIFKYEYTTGSGKTAQTHTCTVVIYSATWQTIDLHMAKHEFLSDIDNPFDKYDRVNLEGDFNKHFDLWITKGYEQDIRQLFTPDAMAAFIDKYPNFSLEGHRGNLAIYVTDNVLSPTLLPSFFSNSLAIMKELAQNYPASTKLKTKSRRA